jgi:hypothetical protein
MQREGLSLFDKVHVEKKGHSVGEKTLSHIQTFLNIAIPIKSGRYYRIQQLTNHGLYERYLNYCQATKMDPVSISYFVFNVLFHEHIHHENNEQTCPICYEKGNLEELSEKQKNKLEVHEFLISKQWAAFEIDLKRVLTEPGVILIVQDFTQIQIQEIITQCFIVTIYYFDEKTNMLQAEYETFLSDKKIESNDIFFVATSYHHLLNHEKIINARELIFYNDGGGHHFKVSATVLLMLFLQFQYKKPITFNFFPSYHGHNVCDGAAAVVKNRLNVYARDYKPIKTQDDIVGVIQGLAEFDSTIIHILRSPLDVKTLKGIKSFHSLKFSGSDLVFCYLYTHQEEPQKIVTVDISQIQPLLSLFPAPEYIEDEDHFDYF